MGCVSSVPEDKDLKEKAAKQRRRLSVSPEQVGDISHAAVQQAEKDAAARRASQQEQAADAPVPAPTPAPDSATATDASASSPAAGNEDVKKEAVEMEVKAPVKLTYFEVSKKGFVPYNRNKVNQDRHVVVERLQSNPDLALFAVMDGHGEFGHLVAQFVKEKLPYYLEQQGNLAQDTPAAMTNAVKGVVDELAGTHINVAFSGTTLVFAIKNGSRLFVGNIGDSRCVLARKTDDGHIEAVPLTVDQKPDNPEEKARILRAGGRVEPLPGRIPAVPALVFVVLTVVAMFVGDLLFVTCMVIGVDGLFWVVFCLVMMFLCISSSVVLCFIIDPFFLQFVYVSGINHSFTFIKLTTFLHACLFRPSRRGLWSQ